MLRIAPIGQVLAQLPLDAGVSVPGPSLWSIELTEDVGHRLVDRARLEVVERSEVNSVTPWVSSWPTTSSAEA